MLTSDVVKHFGTRYKVWRHMTRGGYEITCRAVYKWGVRVPELRAYQLEELTGGKLRRTCKPQCVA